MAGRIRDEAIRDIRAGASLVEVVSDTVALRRRGRSFVGLCPFHAEKTPSFTVSEERGFFHCFGCGAHGDVFAFVMRTESLPFPDAVRRVAQRFGLPVPEEAGGPRAQTEPLVAVSAAAAAFFRRTLEGPGGADARRYLAERGLRDETVARFGLGYAPPAGDALVRHLRAQRLPPEDALAAGLVLRRADGSLYDRFRDRVMFPIADASGRVIAFGGRVLPGRSWPGEPPPKYLNSPESPLFHKGQTLYGLAAAREAIRRTGYAVVVEGYMDVLALAEAGIGQVVAPLGTALTVEQLRLLRRLTDVVIACFDGDEAGRRAAARSFPVFLEAGLWGRGVFLPAGSDPDTFVRTRGAEALGALLARAEPLVDAYLAALAGPRRDAVGRRAEAAREVARVLKRVRNPFEYDVLARLAAERLGVREAMLVELIAVDPALAGRIRREDVLGEFEHPTWRRAAEVLAGTAAESERAAVLEGLPKEVRDRIARRLLGEFEDEDRERAFADCLAAIRSRRQRRAQGELREALRAAEARGDTAGAREAMRRLRELTEKART